MEAFLADVVKLNKSKPFPELRSIEYKKETMDIVFTLQHPPPLNTVTVRATKQYLDFYPRGTVSMLVGNNFHVVPTTANTLEALADHINELCKLQSELRNEDVMDVRQEPSSSWQVAPTLEFEEDETGYVPGLHPKLIQDVGSVKHNTRIILSDHPTIDQATVSIYLDFSPHLSTQTMEAWKLNPKEVVEIRLAFNRSEYLNADVKVQVGQKDHFSSGIFPGAVGQIGRILEMFVKEANELSQKKKAAGALEVMVEFGFDKEDAQMALEKTDGDANEAVGVLQSTKWQDFADLKAGAGDKKNAGVDLLAKKSIPQSTNGFFQQVIDYTFQRLQSLPEFCVICDRPHVFGGGLMLQASVCSRELCVFRYQALDVAKDISSSIAVQTGVMDLLVVLAWLGAKGGRKWDEKEGKEVDTWPWIFNPFPLIMDDKGTPAITPDKKDIEKVRSVLEKIPKMQDIAGSDSAGDVKKLMDKADPLAYKMFSWIISSNKSYLVQVPEADHLSQFGTTHQFLLVQDPPERQAKFNELKAKHKKTLWAFHGSPAQNWHSILRNGLKNATGTSYEINGHAHGSGIYLSPHANISFCYSKMSTSPSAGKTVTNEMEKQYIEKDSMHCIAVCEVIDWEVVRKTSDIWVTPHEECVATRFLFVYDRGYSHGGGVQLEKEEMKTALDNLRAKYS